MEVPLVTELRTTLPRCIQSLLLNCIQPITVPQATLPLSTEPCISDSSL